MHRGRTTVLLRDRPGGTQAWSGRGSSSSGPAPGHKGTSSGAVLLGEAASLKQPATYPLLRVLTGAAAGVTQNGNHRLLEVGTDLCHLRRKFGKGLHRGVPLMVRQPVKQHPAG